MSVWPTPVPPLWDNLQGRGLAERLLTHRDQRFRLGYIIGSWQTATMSAAVTDNGWDYDGGESDTDPAAQVDDSALPTASDIERMHETLRSFLTRIRDLATNAKQGLQTVLDVDLDTVGGSEKEAAQDLFEEIVQTLPDFDDLVNDIMDEIRRRFEGLAVETLRTHSGGWPESWRYENHGPHGVHPRRAPLFIELCARLRDASDAPRRWHPGSGTVLPHLY